jgi:hypothetical protein
MTLIDARELKVQLTQAFRSSGYWAGAILNLQLKLSKEQQLRRMLASLFHHNTFVLL